MIPQEYVQEVVRRNDITDVVQQYVQLRHRGRTCTGLCPFHTEKTPSFVVYPETQSFYCFGCGAGGDVITFVRKISNLGYVEAVKQLASRAGMPLPEEEDQETRRRSRLLEINRCAARYFFEQLNAPTPEANAARGYWKQKRGLSDAAIRRFGLGYAPDSFSGLIHYLKRRGFTEPELEDSGLVKRSAKGNLYDIFRHRVMVPIIDVRGNIIAFGGRVLDDSKPKYINSPETLVYKKSRTLFALNVAKKSSSKRYILCEGYMDVISMHEAGFDTAFCACGTALTAEHVKLLSEYDNEVVLSYDSDEAGQKATERSLGLFSNSPVRVTVLSIPGAKDPDEFIKKYGRDRFDALLNGTSNPTEFALAKCRRQFDLKSDDGRLEYIRRALDILTDGVSPTAQDVYAGRIAEETGVSKTAILNQLNTAMRTAGRKARRREQRALAGQGIAASIRVPYDKGGDTALGAASAGRQLVAAMLKNPDTIPYIRQHIQAEDLILPEMQEACRAIWQCADNGTPVNLTSIGPLVSEGVVPQLSMVLAQNIDLTPSRRDIDMYLERIRQATPKSAQAGKTSDDEFRQLFDSIVKEKTAGEEKPE
ncbi:DNA primase [uncultured Gemmiger sp.]|uniref:DNA primase n=1 Tax=uncultured Gemmiger sp. TaxID=1623490 RepID=UPI0025F0B5BB|nr:DNA primase [uncultured Gemmiger sp.]